MKHKRKLLSVILTVALLMTGILGVSAQDVGEIGEARYSINAQGEIMPYTYFINGCTSALYKNGVDSLRFRLNLSASRTVSKMTMNVNLQRYNGSGWTNVESRYYEQLNTDDFTKIDYFYGLGSGEYRLAIDYYAINGGLQDYVYSVSNQETL